MSGIKGLKLGIVGAAALLVIGAGLVATQVLAASGTASIGSADAEPGAQAVVDLMAEDVGAPGLGAWTLDIEYDNSVVTAVGCTATNNGVCNADFTPDTVRVTGAVAEGMEGDTLLGTITFECGDAEGSSDLDVSIFTFADATLGGPQPLDATTVDGAIDCEEEPAPALPETGMGDGGSGSGLSWLIAALALVGTASLVGVGALRLSARRA